MLPQRVPAGEIKLAEDAEVFEDAWNLLLDLEDLNYQHGKDKERTIEFVRQYVERMRLVRNPCGFWKRTFRPSHC